MLISKEYFVGELYIEGAAGGAIPPATAQLIGVQLESTIQRREKEYLRMFLGNLYDEFILFLYAEDIDEASPFYKLYDYFVDRLSPIAYYVYFHYVRSVNSSQTATGTYRDKSAVNSREKLVMAWNSMVDINREIHEYLKVTFPQYYPNCNLLSYINTLGI